MQPSEPPKPPDFLSELAKKEWERIAPELHHLGLLTALDVGPFAAYCQSFARCVTVELALRRVGDSVHGPLVGVAHRAAAAMMRFGSEFGLTPASRARLPNVASERPSAFDGLLG